MIARSIVVLLTLLLLWSVVTSWLPDDLGWEKPIWNENIVITQDFLYGGPLQEGSVVVLGSSLSRRLDVDSLAGLRAVNLGLAGQGVIDGLKILEASGVLPGVLLIESNLLTRPGNSDFTDLVLSPVGREVRSFLPAMRQRNQPVATLMGGLFYLKNGPPESKAPITFGEYGLNERMLALKREEYRKNDIEEDFSRVLPDLKGSLGELTEAGVKVVFFEMPVHPDLCVLPRATGLRRLVREAFAGGVYQYIPQPNCADYNTTDGHHLFPRSAGQFVGYLDYRLEGMLN